MNMLFSICPFSSPNPKTIAAPEAEVLCITSENETQED